MLAKKISNLTVFCAGIANNTAAKEEKGGFLERIFTAKPGYL